MAGLLTEFLQEQAVPPVYDWGTRNCGLFIADWVKAATGRDPFAAWRGQVRDELSAKLWFGGWGGLARAVGRVARKHGLPMTDDPQNGDIAVCLIGTGACCAVRVGAFWACRQEDGLATIRADKTRVIAAWKVS